MITQSLKKGMGDYSQGKVYRIYNAGFEEFCYVGSTILALNERMRAHRCKAKSNAKYKFASQSLFEEGNTPVIELLEAYPCTSKEELLAKEREWLDKYPDAINKNPPLLSEQERLEHSRAVALKCYYTKHEERKEANRKWKEANKEQQQEYNSRPEVKEKAKENQRARYAAGYKETRNARKREKVSCPTCAKEMNRNSLPDHITRVHPKPQ